LRPLQGGTLRPLQGGTLSSACQWWSALSQSEHQGHDCVGGGCTTTTCLLTRLQWTVNLWTRMASGGCLIHPISQTWLPEISVSFLRWKRRRFQSEKDLEEAAKRVIEDIPVEEFRRFMSRWLARVHKYLQFNGDYFEGLWLNFNSSELFRVMVAKLLDCPSSVHWNWWAGSQDKLKNKICHHLNQINGFKMPWPLILIYCL
jgi:hypothetical protein